MNNKTTLQPFVNYEAFKEALKKEMQSRANGPAHFFETESTGMNGTSDGIILQFADKDAAALIYPQELYEMYCVGIPLSTIATQYVSIARGIILFPGVPILTPEDARQCIYFALINKKWNQKRLQTCPHKEVLDLAAVPKWFTREGDFLVDNNVLQVLGMTADEILHIAQQNTDWDHYICRLASGMSYNAMLGENMNASQMAALDIALNSQLNVLTSYRGVDGSGVVLSDRFMQEAAQQIGADKLCLLPSSRDEMLAIGTEAAGDMEKLKKEMNAINCCLRNVWPGGSLSDSVYCYNAKTHLLSILQ